MVRALPARLVVCLSLFLPSFTASPLHAASHVRATASILDNDDHMAVNNIDMILTNHGSIAFDMATAGPGLVYPNGTGKTAVFAAGLWIGAQVNDTVRVAMGEYVPEYAPGPMVGGTYVPDQMQFHNYRIEKGGAGYPAYLADAVPQGAPLDTLGNPLLLGDALIWSVFNDADPAYHINAAGKTKPLGVEVQQSVFALARAGALGNIVFIKWRLENKGNNRLDSAYVSLWADPDLGDPGDDLVGCDTTLSLGYAYNETSVDGVYGSAPPAVGFHMLQGVRENGVLLGMTSFRKYINGEDATGAVETYNVMAGRHRDGSPLHVCDDPFQPVTTFQVAGDPVSQTGCLDFGGDDRRLSVSTGPFTMLPGDTEVVIVAIEVGQGANNLASVQQLRYVAAAANLAFEPATAVESHVVESRAEDGVNHLAWYVPESPGIPITVERRTAASPWSSVLEAELPTDRVLRFDDTAVLAGERYGYRLAVWSGAMQDYTAETWVQAAEDEVPTAPRLLPARPNPSSTAFQIRHYVPRRGSFRLTVVDAQGRTVRVLTNRELLPGWYDSRWDGRDASGRNAGSGTYFVRFEGMGAVETKKLVLMR
jgi:hypothetical protein